jgi:orotidine-5'-phosphate decarboxylase
MESFIEKVRLASENVRSFLCVGLDPNPQLMPITDVFEFNRAIIDATIDIVCAYKPNMAFYEALGLQGMNSLVRTVEYIKQKGAHTLIIGDGKRGDIGSSMAAYYTAMYESWGFDAITVAPYMGKDSILPIPGNGKGVFVLCRTSNPGAQDFQDLSVTISGKSLPLYQHVALKCSEWNIDQNIGLVVGATYPDELKQTRMLCPHMPILIPGVGTQGGDLPSAIRWGCDQNGRNIIVNSSRQILYSSTNNDFDISARQEALRINQEIDAILTMENKSW